MSKIGNDIIRGLTELNNRLARGDEIRGTRATLKRGKIVMEQNVIVAPARKPKRDRGILYDRHSSSAINALLADIRDLSPRAAALFRSSFVEGFIRTPEDCKHPDPVQRAHANACNARVRDRGHTYQVALDQLLALQKLLASDKRRMQKPCPCVGCRPAKRKKK